MREILSVEPIMEAYFEQCNIGLVFFDLHLNCTFINTYAENLLCKSGEETAVRLNKTLANMLGVSKAKLYSVFKAAAAKGETFHLQAVPLQDEYNHLSYIDWEIRRINDRDNKPVGISLTIIDVTERKNKEEALKQKLGKTAELKQLNNEYEIIFNKTKDIMYIIDVVDEEMFRYLRTNKMHQLLTGYPLGKIKGQTPYDILQKKNADRIMEKYRECCKRKEMIEYELTLDFFGEAAVWSCQLTPVIIDGKVEQLVGTARDITERKNTEKALINSQELFSAAFHANSTPMIITSLKNRSYIDVNNSFLSLIGCTREEVIGKTSRHIGLEYEDLEERDAIHLKLFKKGSIKDCEAAFLIKSGERRIFKVSAVLMDVNGEKSILSCMEDITEQRLAEEDLKLSEERFSKVFNLMPNGLTISKLTENNERYYIDVNPAFEKHTGYKKEDVIGKPAPERLDLLSLKKEKHLLDELLKEGQIENREMDIVTKHGEVKTVLTSLVTFKHRDTMYIVSVCTDLTEKKVLEKEISNLDRLNLIGQVAASIGHEIRNPLTTVKGFMQLIKQNSEILDKDKLNNYYDTIITEADRANAIITEFLSLAKDKKVDLKKHNLNNIINEIQPIMKANAIMEDKQIKLKLNDVPDTLLDEKEIRQLILNLFNNGLEAVTAGEKIVIGTFEKGDKVCLYVKDPGHGIDNDLIDNIGTPFLTTKEEGTGLGLPVCYSIANRHNAQIAIETSKNKGTTFYVYFQKSK